MSAPTPRHLALLASVLLALSALASAAAHAADSPPVVSAAPATAADDVSACVQRSNHLLVYVDVDRSRSIGGTDKSGRRVDGVKAALFALSELWHDGAGNGRPLHVDVRLASFAGLPKNDTPWVPLRDDTLARLTTAADSDRHRHSDSDTDYVLALEAARAALRERSKQVVRTGKAPCKVLLFLTDGRFQLSDRSGSSALPMIVPYAPHDPLDAAHVGAAERAGHDALCGTARHVGLRDAMVGDGIDMFTVALSRSPGFRPGDQHQLQALTVGVGPGGARCGTSLSTATGEYIPVSELTSLFLVFRNLLDPDCAHGGCVSSRRAFVAEPGLSGFVLTASAPRNGLRVTITRPRHPALTLSGGPRRAFAYAGARLVPYWAGTHALDLQSAFELDGRAWLGPWRFKISAPTTALDPSYYSLRLRSDLRPALDGSPHLYRGGIASIRLRLADHRGSTVASGHLAQTARLRVQSLIDGEGLARATAPVRRQRDGTFATSVRVPPDARGDRWRLHVEARFERVSGVAVSSTSATFELPAATSAPGHVGRWILAACVAAVLLALLGWWLLRWRAATFSPSELNALVRTAHVTPGSHVELVPPSDGAREDFEELPYRSAWRRGKLEGGGFTLRGRAGLSPRAVPRGEVTAENREIVAGTIARATLEDLLDETLVEVEPRDGDPRRWTIGLEPGGTWLFAVDGIGEDDVVHGELLALIDAAAPHEHSVQLLDAAKGALVAQDWSGFEHRAPQQPAQPPSDASPAADAWSQRY